MGLYEQGANVIEVSLVLSSDVQININLERLEDQWRDSKNG